MPFYVQERQNESSIWWRFFDGEHEVDLAWRRGTLQLTRAVRGDDLAWSTPEELQVAYRLGMAHHDFARSTAHRYVGELREAWRAVRVQCSVCSEYFLPETSLFAQACRGCVALAQDLLDGRTNVPSMTEVATWGVNVPGWSDDAMQRLLEDLRFMAKAVVVQ